MSVVEKYLTYRGEIQGLAPIGGTVAFVTKHPENQPGSLVRLDTDALTITSVPLPDGGRAIVADGETLWIAGGDRHVYEVTTGAPKTRGAQLEHPGRALALLAGGRIGVLAGSQVLILARKDGKVLQALDLDEPGTCLANDPTGAWLAVGTKGGTVAVFESEGKTEFVPSASAKLHEGSVTALLFEPDDLRFFSAGADLKLLTTHARGRLEPEDKGRANNHTDLVTALIWGPGERFYSGSLDGTIKSWPRTGGVKPNTIKEGVTKVIGLAMVTVHNRPKLVVACHDQTLRIFPVDEAGKIGDLATRVHDAYARAKHELLVPVDTRRQAALKELVAYQDAASLELIADQLGAHDYQLSVFAAETLAASDHPKAAGLLERTLKHANEAIRVTGFRGLQRIYGESSFRPIDLALQTGMSNIGMSNIGVLAVESLQKLAARDEQALSRLTRAVDSPSKEVRQAALVAIESAYDPKSPEPNLITLGSKHADVRKGTLFRFYQRGLLDDPSVQSALRRAADDDDASTRQTAFLLTLHTRPKLLQELRSRDPELDRLVVELETTAAGGTSKDAPKPAKAEKAAKSGAAVELAETDMEPLLQASAARSLDTCLMGAHGLALLGDPRAFGLLLQLSREEKTSARADVCRALAALDDPRAVERLRSLLHDPNLEVRDAAFTALAKIHRENPLVAAESGLNARWEEIRRRALQLLVIEARKPKRLEATLPLLARVLNDSLPSIRLEGFKSVLGLQVEGGGANTLRFALRSVHPEIRREVLTEVIARITEPWGFDLLLEFFNDPDADLRDSAFTFSLKKSRGLEFLDAALGSRYADLRMKAVQGLARKHSKDAQALLVRALADEDRAVRRQALDLLVEADALPALANALENPHVDVRLLAAKAFARHGDPRSLAPLIALATVPEPLEKERVTDWVNTTESALDGLGELGDPAAIPHLIPILDSPHAALQKQAAQALTRVATVDRPDPLRSALQHANPEVKYRAAYGLACLGDASMGSLVFSETGTKILSVGAQIGAALALGNAGEDQLVVFLDNANDGVRSRAVLLLMFRQWKAPQENAAPLLACLSCQRPQLRLTAARALEVLADPPAFAKFLSTLINDRGDKPNWKISDATVDTFAEALVHGDPQLQVRMAKLLSTLEADEQNAFDQSWKIHETRFAKAFAELRSRASKRKAVPLQYTAAQLQDLAFGAYVGLVREQAAASAKGGAGSSDPQAIKVRQSALAHLLHLANVDPRHARSALPVFVQALGDPNQAVRLQAFEQALALGMPASRLAAETLASGHIDLGVRGLELLTGGASEAEGQAVLEQAMLSRKDDLAREAARLLIARLGQVAVGAKALEAANDKLRKDAVAWLASEYEKNPAARDPLRKAVESRYMAIREAAATELARFKDPAAFDALVALLNTFNDPHTQRRLIEVLEALGDPRTSPALLDRFEADLNGKPLGDDFARSLVLSTLGRLRDVRSVDRLLAILDREPKRLDAIFSSLLMISGYDQPIEDPEEENPDDRWLRTQHPRHDAVLARLLDRFSAPADAKSVSKLIAGARWSRGKEVDAPLGALIHHPDDKVRQQVVEAIAWRLRKRGGPAEPLRKALAHRDPTTQFLAAEGLARAGQPDGINVLLASIEFATDLDHRRRTVLALGELGDERAVETILKLANENGHALQESAIEAIGHMGRSPRVAEISALLERQAKLDTGVGLSALKGLRWLDTRSGWQLIRSRAADDASFHQEEAIELLGFNDEPETRDLLLKLLTELADPEESLLLAAQRLMGPDSLEPYYALCQNEYAPDIFPVEIADVLARIQERGDARRIFEIHPRCPREMQKLLATCLLNRSEPPVAEANVGIASAVASTVTLAAHILGRADGNDPGAARALVTAIERWRTAWDAERLKYQSSGDEDEDDYDEDEDSFGERNELTDVLTPCLRTLTWALGRQKRNEPILEELATARPEDRLYRPIRREAVLALASKDATPGSLKALESAALVGDPAVRGIAAQGLAKLDPKRAASIAEKLLTDAVGFRRLTLDGKVEVDALARSTVDQLHSQGVILPVLIARGELETLAGVARNRKLPEATRLGAVEGLAALRTEPAEAILREIGANDKEEDEFRKAAWRFLRRSKRARTKPRTKVEVKS